jgi:hypothetical protein
MHIMIWLVFLLIVDVHVHLSLTMRPLISFNLSFRSILFLKELHFAVLPNYLVLLNDPVRDADAFLLPYSEQSML